MRVSRDNAEPRTWDVTAACRGVGRGLTAWKDLQAGRQLNVCQHCVFVAMKANLLLGRVRRSTASRLRGGMVLEVTSGVPCPVWALWYDKDGDNLKVSLVKGHHGGWGLEHVMYEEMHRELVLFSWVFFLACRRKDSWEDLRAVFN